MKASTARRLNISLVAAFLLLLGIIIPQMNSIYHVAITIFGACVFAILFYTIWINQSDNKTLYQKLRKLAETHKTSKTTLAEDTHIIELVNIIDKQLSFYATELSRSEDKYRHIFDASSDGIVITNDKFDILAANKCSLHFLGISRGAETRANIMSFIPAQYHEAIFQRRAHIEKREITPPLEIIVNRANGGHIFAEINSQVVDFNGEKAVITIVRDLTERKKAEEKLRINETILSKQNEELVEKNSLLEDINDKLNEANEKAKESDKLKTAFLQNMSHEIRTPMNGIIGFSGLLSNPSLSDEKRQYYIATINKSCSQLLLIVNDILDISKLETGQVEISTGFYRLNSMLSDVYSHHYAKSDYKNITLNFNCGLENGKDLVAVDEHKLRQVLNYLIDNAYKFTKQGSVSFGYTVKNDYLEFFVKDTGIGIDPADHKRIFDRFQQVDLSASRRYGGSGLGLAICKGYIELMGGIIWLESEVEKGSTFFFTIPLKPYVQQLAEQHAVIDDDDSTQFQGIKILVAEDEETNFLYIKEILENYSAQILHANNGKDAVYLCSSRNDIDIVVMDIKMPIMDGLEATSIIKKMKPGLPVIAQTAFAMTNDKLKALEAGCDDYISKPIVVSHLVDVIEKHLRKRD